MRTKNERGEEARDYFIEVENKLRNIAIAAKEKNNIALLKNIVSTLEEQQNEIEF